MNELYLFGGAWAACGLLSYGLGVAYFQRRFPEIAAETIWTDRQFHAAMAIFGPFNLITALIFTRFGKHGWML